VAVFDICLTFVFDILKIDKNCTDLVLYILIRGLGALFGWLNPPKLPPVATGLNIVKYDLALFFTRDT